jgi:hypothetical protein
VGENLVIIGGMQTLSSGGDVTTCAAHMPAEIFSLVTQNYTGVFDAAGSQRLAPVPSRVVDAVGGTSSGGAYVTFPKAWSDIYLQYVFNPSLKRPAYQPSYILANVTISSSNSSDNGTISTDGVPSKSIIIGAAVGGAVGGLLLITGILILVYWYRRKYIMTEKDNRQSVTSELPAYLGEVKYDSGPIFRGVPSLSVAQSDGPAELYSHVSSQTSPQAAQHAMLFGRAHSITSGVDDSVLYSISDGRPEMTPSPEPPGRSISP